MKCLKCAGQLRSSTGNRPYAAAGLPEVILCDVQIRRCEECGNEEVVIPAISALHALLAKEFARRLVMLPSQMRFVRKHLGYSRARAAESLGTSESQVDEVESGQDPIPESWRSWIAKLVLESAHIRDFESLPPPRPRPQEQTSAQVTLRFNGHWRDSSQSAAAC